MHTIDDSRDYFFEHLLCDSAIQWEKNGNRVIETPLPFIINGKGETFGTKLKKESFPYIRSIYRYLKQRYENRHSVTFLSIKQYFKNIKNGG